MTGWYGKLFFGVMSETGRSEDRQDIDFTNFCRAAAYLNQSIQRTGRQQWSSKNVYLAHGPTPPLMQIR
jgi:hypothetical protein